MKYCLSVVWTLSRQAYLEAFYKFCSNLGGTTADTMCPILEVGRFIGWKHTRTQVKDQRKFH